MRQAHTTAFWLVAASYVCWGCLALFWKLLSHVDPIYVLAQRIVWSMLFLGLYAVMAGKTEELKRIFRSRKQMLMCLVSGLFVTFNWGMYIYSVSSGRVIDASLGYFMEPLWMTPISLALIVFSDVQGRGSLGVLEGTEFLLLPIAGVVTFVPLLLFNMGVKKIPYYVSGLLMYVNPSLQFTIGLVYFHEPMDMNRLISFVIIWVGILFTVFDRVRMLRGES